MVLICLNMSRKLIMTNYSGLLPTNTFNSKASKLETKIKTTESKPNISNLATVENKIPDSKVFVKKKLIMLHL